MREPNRYRLPTDLDVQALLRDLIDAGTPLLLNPEATATHAHGPSCEARLVSQDAWQDRLVLQPLFPPAHALSLPSWMGSPSLHASGQIDRVDVHLELNCLRVDEDGRSWVAAYPHVVHRYQRREGFRVEPLPGVYAQDVALAPQAEPSHDVALDLPQIELTVFGTSGEPQALVVPVLDLSHHGAGLFVSDAQAAIWPATAPVLAVGQTLHAVWLLLEPELGMRASLRVVHETRCVDPRESPPTPGRRLGCEIEGLSEPLERELSRHLFDTQRRRNHAAMRTRTPV